MEGKFKGWIKENNFGFLEVNDNWGDIFLHISQVPKDITLHKDQGFNNFRI
jgi:cold shock CspA family protein